MDPHADTITETFSMPPPSHSEETVRRLADELATTLSARLELARPVTVEHEFNGMGKVVTRAAGAIIMLLLSALGFLAIYVWNSFADRTAERVQFARDVAREVGVQQIDRDRRQDDALEKIGSTVAAVGSTLGRVTERLEVLTEDSREGKRRLERLEDDRGRRP